MAKNVNLHNAKNAKNDEFYTRLTDIEKELKNYREHFKGKVVYCNCDDARESNFFKFFTKNFEFLGLKKVITTGYKATGKGVVLTYEGDKNGNKQVDDNEIAVKELNGNGDFRSEECIEFLKEADIVVTNPPFSLFREYVAQLMEYGKKFLIVGNINVLHYKWIFPLLRDNQMFCGITKITEFDTPNNEIASVGCHWYTNIDIRKHLPTLELTKKYSDEYVHYDNLDGIDVDALYKIPMDYYGIMGVPDGILEYNTSEFEILSVSTGKMAASVGVKKNYRGRTDISYTINGVHKCPFSRILIRRKK